MFWSLLDSKFEEILVNGELDLTLMAQLQTQMMMGISALIWSRSVRLCCSTLVPKWNAMVLRVSRLPALACSRVVKLSLPAMANMARHAMVSSCLYLPRTTTFSPAQRRPSFKTSALMVDALDQPRTSLHLIDAVQRMWEGKQVPQLSPLNRILWA